MRQTKLFTKTRKEAPRDEVAKNAKLLIRAGFINKEMAGVYSFLPLGLRVLNKIENIVREEMNALGGQEISLTALQNNEPWKLTGRLDTDVAFHTNLAAGGDVILGWSHEEPLTYLLRNHINSYKDLPAGIYQFQTKFRNEVRAKSGLIRGREFLMKDFYSFHRDQADLDAFYEKMIVAYHNVFARTGLGDITHLAFASGGAFSKWSHEFQTESEAGEDTIYISADKKTVINEEVNNEEGHKELGITGENMEKKTGIESGNIFKLGTKYSGPLELNYIDEAGEKKPVIMGCYGLGISRLLGTMAEVLSDDKGLVWPVAVAPFKVHLIALDYDKNTEVKKSADELYEDLQKAGVEVLFDDRAERAGEKFADADLIGLPLRAVVSQKTLDQGQIEVKMRKTGEVSMIERAEFVGMAKKYV
jgi:prolyl-tRNA synthetase